MTELKRTTNVAWRKFLATEAGMEGMLWLRERIPTIDRGTADNIIFDAGKAQGFRSCLDSISDVMGMVEPKEQQLENL